MSEEDGIMTAAEIGASTLDEDFSSVTENFAGAVENPFPLYAELRQTHPVMEGDILARFGVPSQADFTHTGRPVYTLFKYDDVMMVLKDPVTFTASLLNEGLGQFLGDFLLTGMDGDTHKLARALLGPAFFPNVVAKWEAKASRVVREEFVAPMTARGKAELVSDFLIPVPVRLIYDIIGFPNDKAQVEQFASWGMRILVGPTGIEGAYDAAVTAAQEIYDHTIKIVVQRRSEGSGGDDLIGYLLRASYDNRSLSDDEITCFIRQLLPAAAETTTRSFGSMLVALLERPALLDRLRGDRSLVMKTINEGMRWSTASQFLARQCAKDVEIRGVKIAKGSALSLSSGSANRDEEVFENPDEFDIDRPQRANAGFGFGGHICLGMHVAKMEMAAMLNAILDLWPNLRLDPSQPAPDIVGAQLRGPRAIHVVWG